mmetsp:Transcript_22117/g.61523  ORF Transcript_22117/g.61523 Transcript_22117/m.61523 type:complete len:224 (+) Transcript_22117:878-1549(+)
MEFIRLEAKSTSIEVVTEGIPMQTNDAYPGPILLSSLVGLTAWETRSMDPNTNLFIKLLRLTVSILISCLSVPNPFPNSPRVLFSFLALESGSSVGGIVESTRYAVGRIAGAKPFSSSFTANAGFAPVTRPLDIVTAVPITERQASRRDNSELDDSGTLLFSLQLSSLSERLADIDVGRRVSRDSWKPRQEFACARARASATTIDKFPIFGSKLFVGLYHQLI